jgi:hypothetical protein
MPLALIPLGRGTALEMLGCAGGVPGNGDASSSVIPVGTQKRGIEAMVTDRQQITAAQPGIGVMTRAAGQFRQFLCSLHGHDALLHFEQGRLSLQCTSCGYETPGWDLRTEQQQRETAALESRRVVRMPLVRERRVA